MGRIQVVLSDDTEEEFRRFLSGAGTLKKGNISEAIERLIISETRSKKSQGTIYLRQDVSVSISEEADEQIREFFNNIDTLEKELGKNLVILFDRKTSSIYTICNIKSSLLIKYMDLDPSIDPEFQEEFRANRAFEKDNPDYLRMVDDAKKGRQFSDIVIEYNSSPRFTKSSKPLKVFGGQHRCNAIIEANKAGCDLYHGVRVYFDLNKEQRGEIALVSNTNIQVSNDLRDRLDEQSLEPPSKLRNFCHKIGLLPEGKDFSSKFKTKDIYPTVRMMRTFVVNFYLGKEEKRDFENVPLVPYLCSTGGSDEEYMKAFKKHNFSDDKWLVEAGKQFVRLHESQKSRGVGKARAMALNLGPLASWSFAVGLLQQKPTQLKKLYSLPDKSPSKDPLNAEALSKARSDNDPINYRGLATRYGEKERGRLLQLFLLYSISDKSNIKLELCNLAIKSYDTKKMNEDFSKLRMRVL